MSAHALRRRQIGPSGRLARHRATMTCRPASRKLSASVATSVLCSSNRRSRSSARRRWKAIHGEPGRPSVFLGVQRSHRLSTYAATAGGRSARAHRRDAALVLDSWVVAGIERIKTGTGVYRRPRRACPVLQVVDQLHQYEVLENIGVVAGVKEWR